MTDYFVIRGNDDYSRKLERERVNDILETFGYSQVDSFTHVSNENSVHLTSVQTDNSGSFNTDQLTDTISAISVFALSTERDNVIPQLTQIAETLGWTLVDDESGEILTKP